MTAERLESIPATNKMRRGLPNEDVYLKLLELGPLQTYEVTVTPEDVTRWNRLHDGLHQGMPGVAPATILYYPTQSMLGREIKAEGGGGFARYRAEFLAPIPVGKPMIMRGAIVDKFVRRGWGYLAWECEAECDGMLIQRQWKSWAFFVTPEEAATLPERPSDPRPPSDAALGGLGSLQMIIDPDRTRDFEGPGEHNGHTDFSFGRGNGRPGLLAQGELSFGLIYRLVHDHYGEGLAAGGTLDLRFIRPVFTVDTLTARGEIISEQNEMALCRVWAENSLGETVTAGTATARVRH